MSTPVQTVAQPPTSQVIVTPVGVVPTAPPTASPADPQAVAVQQAEARELLEAQTQPPPDPGRALEFLQGSYYFVVGLWPVVSTSSYQYVTGTEQTDLWLLRTIGLMMAVIGVSLLTAMWRRSVALEMIIVAGGIALVLGIMDLINVSVKAVSPVYGLDAIAQAIFVLGWLRAFMSSTSGVHLITR